MANDFTDFERDLLNMASEFKGGKHAKSFLKKEGKKLIDVQKSVALGLTKEKTGNFKKGFKVGKPYKFDSKSFSIRSYNKSPHAHLINNGHRVTSHGVEKGFRPGVDYVRKANEQFENKLHDDTQNFIDDMLNKYGMG